MKNDKLSGNTEMLVLNLLNEKDIANCNNKLNIER